jgi:hypothetical protein
VDHCLHQSWPTSIYRTLNNRLRWQCHRNLPTDTSRLMIFWSTDPLLGNGPYICNRGMRHVHDYITQQQKRGCKWRSVCPLWGYMIRWTKFSGVSECSAVEYSGVELLEQSVRGLLQLSHCELLLLEAGSWGTGTVREPRVRGTSAVGSRYQ